MYAPRCRFEPRDHAMFAARGCASATVDSRGPLVDSVLTVGYPAPSSDEQRAADRPPPRRPAHAPGPAATVRPGPCSPSSHPRRDGRSSSRATVIRGLPSGRRASGGAVALGPRCRRRARCGWCARCRCCRSPRPGALPLNGIDGASMLPPRQRWSIDVATAEQAGWPAGLPGRMRQPGPGMTTTSGHRTGMIATSGHRTGMSTTSTVKIVRPPQIPCWPVFQCCRDSVRQWPRTGRPCR
jgi:hypothetical protein